MLTGNLCNTRQLIVFRKSVNVRLHMHTQTTSELIEFSHHYRRMWMNNESSLDRSKYCSFFFKQSIPTPNKIAKRVCEFHWTENWFYRLPSKTVSVASAETASPTPFSATHSYGASSRPARTGSIRSIDRPFIWFTEYRLCVPDTFLLFLRQTIDGIGSPLAAQKKLATPPTRTDWLIGRFVISGGSTMKKKTHKNLVKKIPPICNWF